MAELNEQDRLRAGSLHEENSLVRGIRSGDQRACERAYQLYQPAMVRSACYYVDRSLAEDVAHDAWIAALKGIGQFEGRSSLKTWLCRITMNKALEALRKGRMEITVDAFPSCPPIDDVKLFQSQERNLGDPELALHTARFKQRVSVVMKLMDRTQANALYLRGTSGLDGKQISDVLSVSHTNLRVILHRARAELTARVGSWDAQTIH